jgi:hypothetical protein
MPRGIKKEVYNISPGGVREDINPLTIPDGDLLSSSNWLTRRGLGMPRPGYSQTGSQLSSADRIIGIGFRGSPLDGNNVVLHTLTKAFSWDGATATDITGTWTTSTADQLVRMVTYVSGGTVWIVRINEANAMDKWNGTGSFANVAAAPTGRDITAVGPYLMVGAAAGDDYAVQWNTANDIDTWPAGNLARLVDTPGKIIAVKALTPLSVAVYKEDCVYLGTLQAAKVAFQFQLIAQLAGPVSPAAVVAALGAHHWLGHNMTIMRFDGTQPQAWTISLGATITNNFDFANKRRTHGCVLDRDAAEIWFWYPDVTVTMKRAISINVLTHAANPHLFTHNITASADWSKFTSLTIDGLDAFSSTINGLDAIFNSIDSMTAASQPSALFGDSSGNFYRFGPYANDSGTAIPWHFEHGYRPIGGIENRAEIDSVVSYWTQGPESITVTLNVTTTDSVSGAEVATADTFDILTDSNHLKTFRGKRGKWVKMKHSAASATTGMEHKGAAILCWPRAMV